MISPFTDKHGHRLTWHQANRKIKNRISNYGLDLKLFILSVFVSRIPFHSLRNLCFKLAGISIGSHSTIHTGARFYQPNQISIGTGTIIGDHATLDGRDQLTIGNHVDIASEVMIFNSKHDITSPEFEPISAPVVIEDYCFIGPRAIIMPGVTVGRGAVVAAGAVVTKSVPPLHIVAGIPATTIGHRPASALGYRLGRFRLFQ